MSTIYKNSVGAPKEANLRRRWEIFRHKFFPKIISIFWDDFSGNMAEIGAWMGHKLNIIKNKFPQAQCVWIEPSKAMRDMAINWLQLENGDLESTGLWNASQDIICLFQVWHHIDPEKYEKCITEIKRILKPNWKLLLLDTFSPEPTEWVVKKKIFDIANRFYAVLSQYPIGSLQERFCHALVSILSPKDYLPEKLWYFSPLLSHTKTAFQWGWFEHDSSNDYSYGISKLIFFTKWSGGTKKPG